MWRPSPLYCLLQEKFGSPKVLQDLQRWPFQTKNIHIDKQTHKQIKSQTDLKNKSYVSE